jgi:hypothetical protein
MHFLAAHQAMGDAQLARMIAGVRARALLTDAQRKQVEDASARMRKRMMGGRGGAMMWRGRRMAPGKPMGPPPPAPPARNGAGS